MLFQETERTELKKILNDTLQKEIVAFLNSFDGVIYIGVDDDGTVIGVDNIDDTQNALPILLLRKFCLIRKLLLNSVQSMLTAKM